jgi:hypothetical protein
VHPGGEHGEHRGEHHRQHGLAGHLPQQLVEIHQAEPEQGLGEEEEVEGGDHRSEGGEGHAQQRQPVQGGEEQRGRSADGQVGEARPLGAGVAATHPADEQRHREEQRPHRPHRDGPSAPGRGGEWGERHAEPQQAGEEGHPAAGAPRLRLSAEELEEEAQRRRGNQRPGQQPNPDRDPHRPAGEPSGEEDALEKARQVERPHGEGEHRVDGQHSRPIGAQHHRQAEGSGHDAGEQGRLGANVHRQGSVTPRSACCAPGW